MRYQTNISTILNGHSLTIRDTVENCNVLQYIIIKSLSATFPLTESDKDGTVVDENVIKFVLPDNGTTFNKIFVEAKLLELQFICDEYNREDNYYYGSIIVL